MENRLKTLEQELRSMKKKRYPVKALSSKGGNSDNVVSSEKKCKNNSDVITKCDTETSRKISFKISDSWEKSEKSIEWKQNVKPRLPENSYRTPTSVSSSSNYIDKYESSFMGNDKKSPEKHPNIHVRSSKFDCKLRWSPNQNGSRKYLYHSMPFNLRKYDRFEHFTKNNNCFDAAHCSTPFSSRKYDTFRYCGKNANDFDAVEVAHNHTQLSSRKDDGLGRFAKNDHDFGASDAAHWYRTPCRSRKCDEFKYFEKNEDNDCSAVSGNYEAHTYYNASGRYATSKRPLNDQNEKNIYLPSYSQSFKFVEKYKYFRRIQGTISSLNNYAPRESSYRLNRQQITKQQLDYELDNYRYTKLPITKEELDDEIDRYMAEAKGIEPVTETNDVDSFVMEYVLEVEKCLNDPVFVDTLS